MHAFANERMCSCFRIIFPFTCRHLHFLYQLSTQIMSDVYTLTDFWLWLRGPFINEVCAHYLYPYLCLSLSFSEVSDMTQSHISYLHIILLIVGQRPP